MRSRRMMAATAAVVLMMAGLVAAAPAQDQAMTETKTITAEVIDTACYMGRGATGAEHAQCAIMCAENGVPLALLDKTNDTVYHPMDGMNNPNDKLKQYAGKTIKVTGTVTTRSKNHSITLDKIEVPEGL